MPVMTDEGSETETAVVNDDDVVDAVVESAAEEIETSDGVEPAPQDEDEALVFTPAGKPGRRNLVLVGAVGGALSLLLAAVGVLGWQVWQQHQITQASRDGQRAAIAYAQVLTSIDSNKVDDNFKEVLDGATGEFKDMYSQSSVELRQLLVENKATAHGVVVDSAVQEASKDKVVVLLFVDQSVSNSKLPDPRIDRSRMKMTLEKVDGRWRASKVELP